jgi:hypothetical protein
VALHVVAEADELSDDLLIVELDAVFLFEFFGDFVNALLGHRAGLRVLQMTRERWKRNSDEAVARRRRKANPTERTAKM